MFHVSIVFVFIEVIKKYTQNQPTTKCTKTPTPQPNRQTYQPYTQNQYQPPPYHHPRLELLLREG